MNILGISAFYHDSAAALVRDGEIIAAAQEERLSVLMQTRNQGAVDDSLMKLEKVARGDQPH